MARLLRALERIRESSIVEPQVVLDACERCGHRWRARILDPVRTVQCFATQILHHNTSIAHTVRLCASAFCEAAYCAARRRLPVELFERVLYQTTRRLLASTPASITPGVFYGHRTLTIDGTGCDMPDTPQLQEHFGQPLNQRSGCGFPVAGCLALFDAPSLMLVDLIASPFAAAETPRAPRLHPHLAAGDLLIGDRGFSSYCHIALLAARGVEALFRAHQSRAIDFPAPADPPPRRGYNRHRREQAVLVERLGSGVVCDDQIVEITKPHNRPGWMSPADFARLPSTLRLRTLRYRIGRPGFRCREIVLMTTLLDPKRYPAEELAALYRSRWQVEINLRNLKQTLGMNSLHCKSVEGVRRELLMFALVYNAVCAEMVREAEERGVAVTRISFIDTLRAMQESRRTEQAEMPPARPRPLKLNPDRSADPDRHHPRCVKRRLRYPTLGSARRGAPSTTNPSRDK